MEFWLSVIGFIIFFFFLGVCWIIATKSCFFGHNFEQWKQYDQPMKSGSHLYNQERQKRKCKACGFKQIADINS